MLQPPLPPPADVELEASVPADLHLVAEEVGLRGVAEGLVQVPPVGIVWLMGWPQALNGEVEKARRPSVSGDPVDGAPVDPCLLIDEVRVVSAELAEGCAERVDDGVEGALRLEGEIERLAQILREEPEAIGPVQRVCRVGVFEYLLAGLLEVAAEGSPGRAQIPVVGTVAKAHRPSPRIRCRGPVVSCAMRASRASAPERQHLLHEV